MLKIYEFLSNISEISLKHYFRPLLAPVDVLCESLIHRQQL